MSLSAQRKLLLELSSLLDKRVLVRTTYGKVFEGTLTGFDHPALNISLVDVRTEGNEKYYKVIISGSVVAAILALQEPLFKLKEFAEILEKYFPNLVKVYEDAGVIMVSDRIKITEEGVEGTGPIAERIRKIFEEYIAERREVLGEISK